MARQGL